MEEWELEEGDIRTIYVCKRCGYPFKTLKRWKGVEKKLNQLRGKSRVLISFFKHY